MAPTIDAIELRRYRLPLDPPFRAAWDPNPRTALAATVVVVRAGGYEGVCSGTMDGFVGNEDLFLGRDPYDIDRHVDVIDDLTSYFGRMWALEVALWDLMGKLRGEPVWRMLGGTTGRVRAYASTGARLPLEERVEVARRIAAEGFPAIKLRMYHDDPEVDLATVRAVRDALGDGIEIMVDANQGWRVPGDTRELWSLETATRVAEALGGLGVFWFEEPLPRHDYRGMAELRARSPVRIAGGESARDFVEMQECLHHGSLDVYQPDVPWSTGVLRAARLAKEVAAAGAMYTPHTWGDGLVLLANLQVAAALSNAPFVEFPYDPPSWTLDRRDYLLPAPIAADGEGYVDLGDGPGIGVELDWDALEAFRVS